MMDIAILIESNFIYDVIYDLAIKIKSHVIKKKMNEQLQQYFSVYTTRGNTTSA